MEQKQLQKKQVELGIGDLAPVVLTLAVAGLGAAFILQVLGSVRDNFRPNTAGCNSTAQSACGSDYNATQNVLNGVAALPEKMPTIGTVTAAAVIIGVLVSAFAFRGR